MNVSSQSLDHSAHIGDEVVIRYRWHPLHGRTLRRHYSEQRADGEVAHVEVAPGIATIVPAWMLNTVACSSMEMSEPRVTISALADLHHLLTTLRFRRSSPANVLQETRRKAISTPVASRPTPAKPAGRGDETEAEPRRTSRSGRFARSPAETFACIHLARALDQVDRFRLVVVGQFGAPDLKHRQDQAYNDDVWSNSDDVWSN